MIQVNRYESGYTAADRETCGCCGMPIGSQGAYYADRVRICKPCSDELRASNYEMLERVRRAEMIGTAWAHRVQRHTRNTLIVAAGLAVLVVWVCWLLF